MASREDIEALATGQNAVIFLPKPAPQEEMATLLVALANDRGGVIFIGLKDANTLGQLPNPQTTRDDLMSAALQCDPPLIISTPQIETYKRKSILVVHIPPDLPHVYNFEGRYIIWSGDRVEPLSGQALRRLIFARGESGFEQLAVPDATTRDLNWEAVILYIRSIEGLRHLSPEEALIKRGCLKEETGALRPTYAGMLLFGLDPQRWLPDSGMVVARYTGLQMSDTFIRSDIQGTLPEQARKAEAFVLENIHLGVTISGLQRTDAYLYPQAAVREVIVNALAHRDYSIKGDNIRLLLFTNRLECYSPGRLAGHVTLHNIHEERFSRNAAIVQVLFDMGFIERLGYGITRIVRSMVEAGQPEPELEETAAGFKITLYNNAAARPQDPLSVRQWVEMGLNERQISALGYVADKGRITNADYQALCPDVSPETLRRDLADLVQRNMLLRIGEKRATFYILK